MNELVDTLDKEDVILPCGLTPKQEQQWNDVMSMVGWRAPGFQHIFYRLLDNNTGKYTAVMTKNVPVAATDAKNILINPDTFFSDKYTLPNRVFIIIHEIMHNIRHDVTLLHKVTASGNVPMGDGTTLPFDNPSMQKAMDWVINAQLKAARMGTPPKDGCYNDEITGEESILDAYRMAYEEKPKGEGEGEGVGGFDQILPPGKSTGQQAAQAAQAHNPQQWAVEIAAAQHIEKSAHHGSMPAALERIFEKLLEPEIDWKQHIVTLINRIGGSGGWNWKQPHEWWVPHDFFAPKKTGRGAGWIVIWGDTSGSRSDKEIASNIAELKGIMEDVNPARLTLIWCDAGIHDGSIVELESPSDLHDLKPVGGGGTSLAPVYKWMEDQMDAPDLFIGFTDGYVGFEKEPKCPVIWASSTDVVYPYGQVVRVLKPKTP